MPKTKETYFDPKLVSDLIEKTKGHSSLAKLSKQEPIPFNGYKEFIFAMDKEIDIVAENGKKSEGGIDLEPVAIIPIKFEYGARVSDEFIKATEEEQINIIKAFNDGFAAKVARGLDLAAFHGVNPRTGSASEVVGSNHFDSKATQTINFEEGGADQNIDDAIALIEDADGEISGMAMAPAMRQALANMKNSSGERLYPELAWGGNPGTINGLAVDVNRTVAAGDTDYAVLGDFENYFKWGYASQVRFEVIEFGDPDNSGKDLKGYNQVYLRAEIFLGWGILNPDAFARIIKNAE